VKLDVRADHDGLKVTGVAGAQSRGDRRVLVYGTASTWGLDPTANGRGLMRLPEGTTSTGVMKRSLGAGWTVIEEDWAARTEPLNEFGAGGNTGLDGEQHLAAVIAATRPLDAVILHLDARDLRLSEQTRARSLANAFKALGDMTDDRERPFTSASPAPKLILVVPPSDRLFYVSETACLYRLGAAFREALPHVHVIDAETLIGRRGGGYGPHFTISEHFVLGKAMADAVSADAVGIGAPPTSDEYRAHLARLSPQSRARRFHGEPHENSLEYAVRQASKATLVGLRTQGRLIGVAELHPIGNTLFEMALSIEDAHQGLGHGTRLFTAALEVARRGKTKRVCFLTCTKNRPMRRLLTKGRAHQMQEGSEVAAWIDFVENHGI
jgi:GNAT superfamily N-acetyltransferase